MQTHDGNGPNSNECDRDLHLLRAYFFRQIPALNIGNITSDRLFGGLRAAGKIPLPVHKSLFELGTFENDAAMQQGPPGRLKADPRASADARP